jgi:hypothetical protein
VTLPAPFIFYFNSKTMIDILIYLGIGVTVFSYIYLLYFFIKEKIYNDFGLFDLVIFLLGPIGLLFVLVMGYITYNDNEINE